VPDLPAVLRAGLRQLGDQVTAPAPSPAPLSRAEQGIGRRDPLAPRGMVRFLTKPAAFFAANWAAMLGILTVVGIVPALAGATRVTGDLAQYEEEAFTSTLRHVRRTLQRDGPASVLLLLVLGGIGLNGLVLPRLTPDLRVFAVGLMLPVVWGLVGVLSAYVAVAAQDAAAARSEVMLRALALVVRRPAAALAAPALVALLSPLWLLAPLTIACGFSIPPWVLGRLWGVGRDGGRRGGRSGSAPPQLPHQHLRVVGLRGTHLPAVPGEHLAGGVAGHRDRAEVAHRRALGDRGPGPAPPRIARAAVEDLVHRQGGAVARIDHGGDPQRVRVLRVDRTEPGVVLLVGEQLRAGVREVVHLPGAR